MKPTEVNILGIKYKINYYKDPVEVDVNGKEGYWGQIVFWDREIRILDNGKRTDEDIFQTILHEVGHGLAERLKSKCLDDDDNHAEFTTFITALSDTLVRNDWVII